MSGDELALAELPLAAEDAARAGVYALLVRLLYGAPDAELLQRMARSGGIAAPDTALAQSWRTLQEASQAMDADAANEEYAQVFIGLGQGEVVPYMSWHLTGFMMEEPLARLRETMGGHGIQRMGGVAEPEDHMAMVCEMMRFLVAGDESTAPAAVEVQRVFFRDFMLPWYANFSAQLETAPSANYYRAVARLLRDFLDVETAAFDIAA